MTPKEKAEELVNKLRNGLFKDRGVKIYSEDAIYCALIAVDEIYEEIREYCEINYHQDRMIYWSKVKQEIENL